MLGRLQMPVSECITAYLDMSKKIFGQAHVMDENCDFDAYCQMARHFAHGEKRVGNKRREFANRRKQQASKAGASNSQQTRGQPSGSKSTTPQTQSPSFSLTCYGCGKKGHLKRDCPDKGETKAINLDEDDAEQSEDFSSQDEAENE